MCELENNDVAPDMFYIHTFINTIDKQHNIIYNIHVHIILYISFTTIKIYINTSNYKTSKQLHVMNHYWYIIA